MLRVSGCELCNECVLSGEKSAVKRSYEMYLYVRHERETI